MFIEKKSVSDFSEHWNGKRMNSLLANFQDVERKKRKKTKGKKTARRKIGIIFFFILQTSFLEFKTHGQFEWHISRNARLQKTKNASERKNRKKDSKNKFMLFCSRKEKDTCVMRTSHLSPSRLCLRKSGRPALRWVVHQIPFVLLASSPFQLSYLFFSWAASPDLCVWFCVGCSRHGRTRFVYCPSIWLWLGSGFGRTLWIHCVVNNI